MDVHKGRHGRMEIICLPTLALKSLDSYPLGIITITCFVDALSGGAVLFFFLFFMTLSRMLFVDNASASGLAESTHSPFLQCFFFLSTENRIIYSKR